MPADPAAVAEAVTARLLEAARAAQRRAHAP